MPNPSTFLEVSVPIGVAATQDGLLFTTYSGQPAIFKVSATKTVTPFAPSFPAASGEAEKYLDVNPGLGPWATKFRYVYVTQGSEIFEITPDGSSHEVFATLPVSVVDHTGITFDRVGTFNNDMIVTTDTGHVFRINSGRVVTEIITMPNLNGTWIENPAVVPATLGPQGGQIWVAAEQKNSVYSIDINGKVTLIAGNIPAVEYITVIPESPTNLGSSGGSYFAVDYPTRIVEYPASDFSGLGGNVLVGSEIGNGPLTLISFTGGLYKATTFEGKAFIGQAEGAAFVEKLRRPYIYAAKFVCGTFPLDKEPTKEGPVEPGSYATAINVHNPNFNTVTIVKKAVLLFDGREIGVNPEVPRPPNNPTTVNLDPDWGLEIDAPDIRNVLLKQPSGAPGPQAPIFIKGWIVIESPDPLDVVAVYTVRGVEGQVSIATDRVVPTRPS